MCSGVPGTTCLPPGMQAGSSWRTRAPITATANSASSLKMKERKSSKKSPPGLCGWRLYQPRIGCYAVYEPNEEGWHDSEKQISEMNAGLTSRGLDVITAPEAVMDDASCRRVGDYFAGQKMDALHALVASWSFDHHTVESSRKWIARLSFAPSQAFAPGRSSVPCS